MALRITNLRMSVEQPETELPKRIARRLKLSAPEVLRWRILRKSLDARSRSDLQFVYSTIVELHNEPACLKRLEMDGDIATYLPESFDDPDSGKQTLSSRPIVVGSGPAGLLAGYYLARRGYRPLIIERGQAVKDRVPVLRAFDRHEADHQNENNYLFGEGGAGAFSDGKLTCRMTGADVDWVLEAFVECGGRSSIMYEHRPHLGSNKLPMICRNFRRKIEALGGEYKFGCRLESLDVRDGSMAGLHTSSGYIPATHVVLGIGHSARDTYEMLHAAGIPFQQKAFQLGLRIEQPQAQVDQWKYGRDQYRELLGAADYTLVAKGQRDLYSFCMCAGGVAIPSISEPNQFCTNGMSNSRHDTPFANSGLMITLEPNEFGSDHPLAGVELQRRYEAIAFELGKRDYLSPIQWARDFVVGRTSSSDQVLPSSYQRGTVNADLQAVLPPAVIHAIRAGLPIMDKRWRGRFLENATLIGPEMRGSSPVRIDRDRTTRQVPGLVGMYPVGEGAGYAGGIISAAVDGLRSAREIVRQFAPLSA
ncbi:MAG: NAD(P)-binding protein [Planctomycetaceae bacterium]|nr:NAD(P)-binding protein [Planctomycetales bacterium]MCB9874106.1 NAD(P)-binding protein [Planctomycetaceae bacterium]MCB9940559.1 NAD(P)-binding protein [Planctomycetaceae bacterium]HRX77836.1 NAD(P)-binding protein [Pirellulaceae bacterium]